MEVKIYLSPIKVPLWCQTCGRHHSANVEQYWQIHKHELLCICVNACIYAYVGTWVSTYVGARGCLHWGSQCYPSSLLVYVCLFAVSRHGLSLPGTHQVPKLAGQRAARKPPVSPSPVITKHILPTLAFCMQILGTELKPYDWQGQVSSLTGTVCLLGFFSHGLMM